MLLLGALFALFIAGFWLYCLIDVALTPRNECRGLPKAAWVVIVAGTFAVGAVAWLAVRGPARPAPPSTAAGHQADPGQARRGRPRTSPAGHDAPARGLAGPAAPDADDPDSEGPGSDGPGPDGSGPPQPPEGRDRPFPRYGRPDPADWDGPVHDGRDGPDPSASLAAEAALLRHPAGRARPRRASSPSRPKGPDDDPEFLISLDRAIHGLKADDDPAE